MRSGIVLGIVLVVRTATAAPCPTGKRLVDVARIAFAAERRTVVEREIPVEARRLQCRTIRGPTPLALVTFHVDANIVLGAVLNGDQVLWSEGQADDCTPCTTRRSISVADLDGDGVDELLVRSHRTGHMATSGERLEVLTIGDDGVPVVPTQPDLRLADTSSYDGYWCSSSLRVIAGPGRTRRLELVGTCSGTWTPPEFPVGRHVYSLRGGAVEETTP